MRTLPLTLLLSATLALAPDGALGVEVGVSVSIAQPGLYGRIDIGRFPQPQVVLTAPIVIHGGAARRDPVYLWVPPGHQKNWRKHCQRYDACGVPVYFVRDDWYERHVMADTPRRGGKGHERDPGKGHGRGRGHD